MMRRIQAACSVSGRGLLLFSTSRKALGIEQIDDVPTSTSRKPSGLHRGPGKRMTSAREAESYKFIKKWDLQMKEQWDEMEPFKGIPKPKKQFGNESTEIIWPYALLMERMVKVHPFTKSIYVYYSQKQATESGAHAAEVAKLFSRKSLIPITFHNSQCYVETEMLLEYNETPWVVVNCLDGRQELIPVKPSSPNTAEAEEELLMTVVKKCEALGSSVEDAKGLTRALNERPLQNQYLRINYQWFGDTVDERMSHLVRWNFDDVKDVAPKIPRSSRVALDWLSFDGSLPNHNSVKINVGNERRRLRTPTKVQGIATFANSGSRSNARYSRFGGTAGI